MDFLRPEPLGFTLPRLAVALIPNANNRKPSFLILIAAFTEKRDGSPWLLDMGRKSVAVSTACNIFFVLVVL